MTQPGLILTPANMHAAIDPQGIEVFCDFADRVAVTNDGFCQFCGSTEHRPLRPAKQVPASTPITEPVDHGPSVWGGRVLQMPPSEISPATPTRLVEYVGATGATYRLVDADGVPAEYGRTYIDQEGDEFALTPEYGKPSADDPRVAVTFVGCLPAFLDVEHNEALTSSWHFARIA